MLKIFMTDDFFADYQRYKTKEPTHDTWGTFWDTLKLVGIFDIPSPDNISVSILFGRFTQEGDFWFVFNLFPTDEARENPVGPSFTIENDILRTADRWNMKLTLIYDGNGGFLVQNFMHTYDR